MPSRERGVRCQTRTDQGHEVRRPGEHFAARQNLFPVRQDGHGPWTGYSEGSSRIGGILVLKFGA